MIEMNRNSLLYKFVYHTQKPDPSNQLCVFFWQAVFSVVKVLGAVYLVAAFGGFWYELTSPGVLGDGFFATTLVVTGMFITAIMAIAALFFAFYGLVYLCKIIFTRYSHHISNMCSKVEKPGLLIHFIRAKAEKMCPSIRWVDK